MLFVDILTLFFSVLPFHFHLKPEHTDVAQAFNAQILSLRL